MSNKAFQGGGVPDNEFLGPGAVYFNYGETDEILIGVTKGGNEFTDGAEFREREADADIFPIKGAKDIIMFRPQLTVRSLKINVQNMLKYYAGLAAETASGGTQVLYRTLDLSDSYIDNVAWVGQDRNGNNMAIVVKNALGDVPLSLSMAKNEEIIPEIVFTGHADPATFDPETSTTYPFYVEFEVSAVTFTVTASASPLASVAITLDDGQTANTDASGQATFYCTFGKVGYTCVKATYTTVTGTVTVDEATEAVAVTMVLAS